MLIFFCIFVNLEYSKRKRQFNDKFFEVWNVKKNLWQNS